jgi:DNA-directed RNA polymerase specialized sigma24 family protein
MEKKTKKTLEGVMFSIPKVIDPIVGNPKEAKGELEDVVLGMQNQRCSFEFDYQFNRVVVYMHKYFVNLVFKQFPYIRGMDHSDTYQEALIALRFKAIPGFKKGKGMSFLNFAKMCCRRHLITILNASNNRQKDQSMNRAISIDSEISPCPSNSSTFACVLADKGNSADYEVEHKESLSLTKSTLMNNLSDYERMVLEEYLNSSSYKEIGESICERLGENYQELCEEEKSKKNKAVDNALWRIRRKASKVMDVSERESIPIFLKRKRGG